MLEEFVDRAKGLLLRLEAYLCRDPLDPLADSATCSATCSACYCRKVSSFFFLAETVFANMLGVWQVLSV